MTFKEEIENEYLDPNYYVYRINDVYDPDDDARQILEVFICYEKALEYLKEQYIQIKSKEYDTERQDEEATKFGLLSPFNMYDAKWEHNEDRSFKFGNFLFDESPVIVEGHTVYAISRGRPAPFTTNKRGYLFGIASDCNYFDTPEKK